MVLNPFRSIIRAFASSRDNEEYNEADSSSEAEDILEESSEVAGGDENRLNQERHDEIEGQEVKTDKMAAEEQNGGMLGVVEGEEAEITGKEQDTGVQRDGKGKAADDEEKDLLRMHLRDGKVTGEVDSNSDIPAKGKGEGMRSALRDRSDVVLDRAQKNDVAMGGINRDGQEREATTLEGMGKREHEVSALPHRLSTPAKTAPESQPRDPSTSAYKLRSRDIKAADTERQAGSAEEESRRTTKRPRRGMTSATTESVRTTSAIVDTLSRSTTKYGDDLDTLTMAVLRNKCQELGLSTNGTKRDLKRRIRSKTNDRPKHKGEVVQSITEKPEKGQRDQDLQRPENGEYLTALPDFALKDIEAENTRIQRITMSIREGRRNPLTDEEFQYCESVLMKLFKRQEANMRRRVDASGETKGVPTGENGRLEAQQGVAEKLSAYTKNRKRACSEEKADESSTMQEDVEPAKKRMKVADAAQSRFGQSIEPRPLRSFSTPIDVIRTLNRKSARRISSRPRNFQRNALSGSAFGLPPQRKEVAPLFPKRPAFRLHRRKSIGGPLIQDVRRFSKHENKSVPLSELSKRIIERMHVVHLKNEASIGEGRKRPRSPPSRTQEPASFKRLRGALGSHFSGPLPQQSFLSAREKSQDTTGGRSVSARKKLRIGLASETNTGEILTQEEMTVRAVPSGGRTVLQRREHDSEERYGGTSSFFYDKRVSRHGLGDKAESSAVPRIEELQGDKASRLKFGSSPSPGEGVGQLEDTEKRISAFSRPPRTPWMHARNTQDGLTLQRGREVEPSGFQRFESDIIPDTKAMIGGHDKVDELTKQDKAMASGLGEFVEAHKRLGPAKAKGLEKDSVEISKEGVKNSNLRPGLLNAWTKSYKEAKPDERDSIKKPLSQVVEEREDLLESSKDTDRFDGVVERVAVKGSAEASEKMFSLDLPRPEKKDEVLDRVKTQKQVESVGSDGRAGSPVFSSEKLQDAASENDVVASERKSSSSTLAKDDFDFGNTLERGRDASATEEKPDAFGKPPAADESAKLLGPPLREQISRDGHEREEPKRPLEKEKSSFSSGDNLSAKREQSSAPAPTLKEAPRSLAPTSQPSLFPFAPKADSGSQDKVIEGSPGTDTKENGALRAEHESKSEALGKDDGESKLPDVKEVQPSNTSEGSGAGAVSKPGDLFSFHVAPDKPSKERLFAPEASPASSAQAKRSTTPAEKAEIEAPSKPAYETVSTSGGQIPGEKPKIESSFQVSLPGLKSGAAPAASAAAFGKPLLGEEMNKEKSSAPGPSASFIFGSPTLDLTSTGSADIKSAGSNSIFGASTGAKAAPSTIFGNGTRSSFEGVSGPIAKSTPAPDSGSIFGGNLESGSPDFIAGSASGKSMGGNFPTFPFSGSLKKDSAVVFGSSVSSGPATSTATTPFGAAGSPSGEKNSGKGPSTVDNAFQFQGGPSGKAEQRSTTFPASSGQDLFNSASAASSFDSTPAFGPAGAGAGGPSQPATFGGSSPFGANATFSFGDASQLGSVASASAFGASSGPSAAIPAFGASSEPRFGGGSFGVSGIGANPPSSFGASSQSSLGFSVQRPSTFSFGEASPAAGFNQSSPEFGGNFGVPQSLGAFGSSGSSFSGYGNSSNTSAGFSLGASSGALKTRRRIVRGKRSLRR